MKKFSETMFRPPILGVMLVLLAVLMLMFGAPLLAVVATVGVGLVMTMIFLLSLRAPDEDGVSVTDIPPVISDILPEGKALRTHDEEMYGAPPGDTTPNVPARQNLSLFLIDLRRMAGQLTLKRPGTQVFA